MSIYVPQLIEHLDSQYGLLDRNKAHRIARSSPPREPTMLSTFLSMFNVFTAGPEIIGLELNPYRAGNHDDTLLEEGDLVGEKVGFQRDSMNAVSNLYVKSLPIMTPPTVNVSYHHDLASIFAESSFLHLWVNYGYDVKTFRGDIDNPSSLEEIDELIERVAKTREVFFETLSGEMEMYESERTRRANRIRDYLQSKVLNCKEI